MKYISATIKSKHRNSNGNSFFLSIHLFTFLPGNVSSALESLLYDTQLKLQGADDSLSNQAAELPAGRTKGERL